MMLSTRHRPQSPEELVPLGVVQRAEQQPRSVTPNEKFQALVNFLGVNRNGVGAELLDGARKNVGSQARLGRGVDHHQSCVAQGLLDAYLAGGRRKLHSTLGHACLPTLQLGLKASTCQEGCDLDALRMFDRNDSHPLPPLRPTHPPIDNDRQTIRDGGGSPEGAPPNPRLFTEKAFRFSRCHSCPAPVCERTQPF